MKSAIRLILTPLLFLPHPSSPFSTPTQSQRQRSTSLSATNDIDRRSILQQGGMALTSSLLLPPVASAIQDYDTVSKRILITGSNSGIGLDAAMRMALRGHEIILACVSKVYALVYRFDFCLPISPISRLSSPYLPFKPQQQHIYSENHPKSQRGSRQNQNKHSQ